MNTPALKREPVEIARFAIGADAYNDNVGVVVVRRVSADLFEVLVNGGVLPDGRDVAPFANATLAFKFAGDVVEALTIELLDVLDSEDFGD